jgi:hypothetical protein
MVFYIDRSSVFGTVGWHARQIEAVRGERRRSTIMVWTKAMKDGDLRMSGERGMCVGGDLSRERRDAPFMLFVY